MQPATSPTYSDTSSWIEGNDILDEERVSSLLDGRQSPECSTELLVLDSLFPVVKFLPGLTREKNSGYYYLQGTIEASDQESLSNHTKRIGELTLGGKSDFDSLLAPHLLTRIAQLQDPSKPLFPHLHRLRIIHTSSSLNFLHPLLSPALTTLELTAIPVDDPCYYSVLSFLECAIHQAPHLSTLVLGPGQIQDQILNMSWRFKNLRCFKLLDVEISITDQFLQHIGSLQHLETFVIRTNSPSTYERSPAVIVLNNPDVVEAANINFDADQKIIGSPLFSALRTFEVDGIFDLIEDLVAKITSSDLRALSIDITKPLGQTTSAFGTSTSVFDASTSAFGMPYPAPRTRTPSPAFRMPYPAPRTRTPSPAFGMSSPAFEVQTRDNSQLREVEQPPPTINSTHKKKGKKKGRVLWHTTTDTLPHQPPPPPKISTTDIMTLLRRSIHKWPNTLVSVSLKKECPSSFVLPFDVFGDLLLRPEMKHLDISGMGIDSMDGTILRLAEVADSQLEELYLPVYSDAPAISPARLRNVAEACPRLKSLRCRLRTWDLDPSEIMVSSALSHQLESLSVRNEPAQPEQRLSLGIARYLDSVFPRLKSIKTHNEDGTNTEQWAFIFDLVKSYQAVRMDEHQRIDLAEGVRSTRL